MNLNKIKAKEKFLSNIQTVDREELLQVIKDNTDSLDLYTYFVTLNAHNTEEVPYSNISDLILKLYADWYFLTKNNEKSIATIKLYDNYRYSPLGMSKDECMNLIKSEEFGDIIPIKIQYTNKLQEKFFTSIRIDKLYDMKCGEQIFACRLYLNLPSNKIIYFVEEFLERCYLDSLPCNIKFFSSDERCDDVIIYCDYEYAQKITDAIESIKEDYAYKLQGVADVNPLLGKVNEYIGFGEQPVDGTYFSSRAQALSSLTNIATHEVLKNNFVSGEEKLIFKSDGWSFTPTEYLAYLIEKISLSIIDEKINKLEDLQEGLSSENELAYLYKLRENLNSEINIPREVNKLKRAVTTTQDYTLSIDGVGSSEYNFIEKLYNLFSPIEDKYLKRVNLKEKKKLVAQTIFKPTTHFDGSDTREYLYKLFKHELSYVLDRILEEEIDKTKYARQSSILNNLKIKECMRLKSVIKAILNDDDDGVELVDSCISDYIRILSCGAMESVSVNVCGKEISMDENISDIILKDNPNLREDINAIMLNDKFIDNIMIKFDINPDNIAVNSVTKNRSKKRERGGNNKRKQYYYDPEINYKNFL